MKNRLPAESSSSLFVSIPAILFSFAAGIGAELAGYSAPALFLLLIFLLCLIARVWGAFALRNISVSLSTPAGRLFQDQEAVLTYTVSNNKLLPLFWLEIVQKLPKTRCLWPENEDEIYEIVRQGEAHIPNEWVAKSRFSLLLWNQTLSWDTVWRARKRGLYPVSSLKLVTGDGFGLMQCATDFTPQPPPVFVVYPRIQPVNVESFLRSYSNCFSGSKGYLSDPTLIKGSREYQTTDSWKHINWRLTAREQKLHVNMFETILPKSAHFMIDGESFNGLSPELDELEEALSVVASVILRLEDEEIRCGLSLPRGEGSPPFNFFPAQGAGPDEALYHLSGYRCLEKHYDPDELYQKAKTPAPSEFDERSTFFHENALGKVYYVVHDAEKIKNWALLEKLGSSNVTIISYAELRPAALPWLIDYQVVSLHGFKRR